MDNKENKKIIIIIVLVVILLALVGLLVYKNMSKNNKNQQNSQQKDNMSQVEAEEYPSILNVKDNLNIPVIIINNYIFVTQLNYEKYIITDLFKTDNLNNIDDNDKLFLALEWNNKKDKKTEITEEFITSYNGKDTLSEEAVNKVIDENGKIKKIDEENYYIEESNVEEKYNQVFGEYDNPTDVLTCPYYFYDSSKKIFLYNRLCGGLYDQTQKAYIYDYKNSGKKYEIYVAVGYSKYDGEKQNIYSSYITNNIYKEGIDKEEMINFKIDDSNYNNFDHFKVIFEKDNNNFIFKSVEKVK